MRRSSGSGGLRSDPLNFGGQLSTVAPETRTGLSMAQLPTFGQLPET